MTRALRHLLFVLPFCWAAGLAFAEDAWQFESISGERVQPFAAEETKLIVAVFITPDCPIANYFQPTLRRLQEKHSGEGVAFVLFHSDPTVTKAKALAHAKDYGITASVVLDPDFRIAKRLDAEVTPEAFVIARGGEIKYRGRINDMYTAFGKKRRAPRTHDLDNAIGAVLAGKDVLEAKTKPIGCYIPYPGAKSSE